MEITGLIATTTILGIVMALEDLVNTEEITYILYHFVIYLSR